MGSLQYAVIAVVLFIFASASSSPAGNLKVKAADDEKDWWQSCSLYQIYPRSFKDSDGDGIGDIKGITQSLGHLKRIGVTATWLSPVFRSPMVDFGYDISDFYNIQPEYGTLEDFDELIAEAHKLGLKVILDFVPNHTSDQCEWFEKSLKNDAQYADYYMWHPGYPDPNNSSNRLPPTNWRSVFWKSAWTWRDERKAFYLHQFAKQQPDLNFRNPRVVQEMKDIMTFWFKRGADGFRIDAIPHLFEVVPDSSGRYPDEPVSGSTNETDDYYYLDHPYTRDLPETLDMVYQWRKLTDDFQKEFGGDTRLLLTEAYSSMDIIMQYYGNETHEGSHLPFNFMFIDHLNRNSNAKDYVDAINGWMDLMPQGRTANWVLGNHDKPRAATRFGEEKIDLLNMMMMMMPGATVTYNGEEIGMTDVHISWEDTVDPQACGSNPDVYFTLTRDPCRTPFQWDDSTSAGFSTSTKTWLPVSEKYPEVNVKRQGIFVKSPLKTYIEAKKLRDTSTLKDGAMNPFPAKEWVLVIFRLLKNEPSYVYIANVGSRVERVDLARMISLPNTVSVAVSSSESPRRIGETVMPNNIMLLPNEALILSTSEDSTSLMQYYLSIVKS